MLYTESFFSTTYSATGYNVCLQSGETVEAMMQGTEENGTSGDFLQATVQVESSTAATGESDHTSVSVIYRFTATADNTDVNLNFQKTSGGTLNDIYVQYAAKIYKNEPNQDEH